LQFLASQYVVADAQQGAVCAFAQLGGNWLNNTRSKGTPVFKGVLIGSRLRAASSWSFTALGGATVGVVSRHLRPR
jgi:hypothetical protein